jgi:hypothetical protein
MKGIVSARDFARRLGTTAHRLRDLARDLDRSKYSHYRFWSEINKKTGKVRHFRIPDPELMDLQRKIKDNVLGKIDLADAAHGGVRGRSPYTNALPHLGQACVITLDVRQFFPRVRHYVVRNMLRREYGYGREVAHLLTRLTTLDGQLPQGSPTSTAVANVLLTNAVDAAVSVKAKRIGAENTRFVDDLALSGRNPRSLINDAARALSAVRLPIWRKKAKFQSKPKFKITPRSKPQEVTGLIVNCVAGPSISRKKRDGIKAAIFQAATLPAGVDRMMAINSIRGRLIHLRRFNPGSAVRLQKYFVRLCAE